jgi:hypothetical protein
MSGVERTRIDTEHNFLDVIDKVQEIYGGLFEGAPALYDVVLMNPPFGGKEGKEARTRFAYKTGATQVLFLQLATKMPARRSNFSTSSRSMAGSSRRPSGN